MKASHLEPSGYSFSPEDGAEHVKVLQICSLPHDRSASEFLANDLGFTGGPRGYRGARKAGPPRFLKRFSGSDQRR